MTRKIEFNGHVLIVQMKDLEITSVFMNVNGIYISIEGLLHPEYLEQIKNKLI